MKDTLDLNPNRRRHFRTYVKEDSWDLLPYGYWMEPNGSKVIFDNIYRPLIRITPDGSKMIVPSDEGIRNISRYYFYDITDLIKEPSTLKKILLIVQEYQLEDEIRQRWVLKKQEMLSSYFFPIPKKIKNDQ